MTLSGDQEALLNLLFSRGKTPEQIAGILGVERSELDVRLTGALEALAPGAPPLPTVVSLYLVGRADPISRADAASALEADPALARRSEAIEAALAARFPGTTRAKQTRSASDLPPADPLQAGKDPGPPETFVATPDEGEGGRKSLDQRNRRLLSILVAAAGLGAVVAAVVLVFGGGDGDSDPDAGPSGARLSPVEGESGRGSVEFGFAGTSFAANLSFSGLERNSRGQSYALWLDGPAGAFPVERLKVGAQGAVAGQAVLNEAIICFIAADLFTDLRLARSRDSEFRKALRQAVGSGDGGPFPEFVGQTVLTGRITMPEDTRETLVRECGGRNPEAGSQGS